MGDNTMAVHSYSRCWLHLIWGTLHDEKILTSDLRSALSGYFYDYAQKKGIYMRINFVSPDHVHALIDLPRHLSIEEIFHLLKGSSSNWINQNDFLKEKFAWAKGYAGFSVSHSKSEALVRYIANQEKRHWEMSFKEEYEKLIKKHGLIIYKEN